MTRGVLTGQTTKFRHMHVPWTLAPQCSEPRHSFVRLPPNVGKLTRHALSKLLQNKGIAPARGLLR